MTIWNNNIDEIGILWAQATDTWSIKIDWQDNPNQLQIFQKCQFYYKRQTGYSYYYLWPPETAVLGDKIVIENKQLKVVKQ